MTPKRTTLFDILDERGISQRWLAQQIGLHETVLSQIRKGKRRMPLRYRHLVAKVLQLPESILFLPEDVRESTENEREAS